MRKAAFEISKQREWKKLCNLSEKEDLNERDFLAEFKNFQQKYGQN